VPRKRRTEVDPNSKSVEYLRRRDKNRKPYFNVKWKSRWITVEDVGRGGQNMNQLLRSILPKCPGAYAVYGEDSLIYVGSSKLSLRQRLNSHLFAQLDNSSVSTRWGVFGRIDIKYFPCETKEEAMRKEARLIFKLRPPFNEALPISRIN
jgi:hypothetical protein